MRFILAIVLFFSLKVSGQVINASQPYRPVNNNNVFTFLNRVGKSSTNANGFTTESVNTTGATLLVAALASYKDAAEPSISDSKGNTWVPLQEKINTLGVVRIRLYYSINPATDAAHTFTVGTGVTYPSLNVLVFSSNKTPIFDNQNGTSGGNSPVSTGTVIPSAPNELLIATLGANYEDTIDSISAGWTHFDNASIYSSAFFLSTAYKIQNTSITEGCTFTWSPSPNSEGASVIACFK